MAEAARGGGRLRFATHQFVATDLRKLYQPNHDRFYAVVVELFCDAPGLPRPGAVDDVELGLVMRRRSLVIKGTATRVRRAARDLTRTLAMAQHKGTKLDRLKAGDVDQVLYARLAHRRQLQEKHLESLAGLGVSLEVEGWMVGSAGGNWRRLGSPPPPGTVEAEQELPMWRIPPRPEDCRGGVDPVAVVRAGPDVLGRPRRRRPAQARRPGGLRAALLRPAPAAARPRGLPADGDLERPDEPFRLAAFADPEGTRNRVFSIRMPDLRTVAARAGERPRPGGVAITSPPESQLTFNPGGGTPSDGSPPSGTVDRTCTFALEIFMIVAMFVFSLFLPIVVLLFQLWWLLALRFCLPSAGQAASLLTSFFASGKTLATSPDPTLHADAADAAGRPDPSRPPPRGQGNSGRAGQDGLEVPGRPGGGPGGDPPSHRRRPGRQRDPGAQARRPPLPRPGTLTARPATVS